MTQDLRAVAWPIRTDRLTIRPVTLDDAEVMFDYRRRPEVHEWLSSAPADLDAFHGELEQRLARALAVERDGAVVGDVMIRIQDAWSQHEVTAAAAGTQAELGWVLDPEHAGQGLATEAVVALLDVCFGPLGLRRVVADCFADNMPSWRLMERIGMRRESHTIRDSLHRTKGWLDGYTYALLAEEWRAGRFPHRAGSSVPSGPRGSSGPHVARGDPDA